MPTIRTASDRILATVEAIGGIKDGTYGPYQSVLFKSDRLPDGQVWRSMQPEQAQQFSKGQRVHLVPTTNKQGKPSWDIELLEEAAAGPQLPVPVAPVVPAQPSALSPEQKRQIAAYVAGLVPLYGFCRQQAEAGLPDASEVAIAMASNALFAQACHRFGL